MKKEKMNKIANIVKEWTKEAYPSDTVYELKKAIRFDYAVSKIKEKINEVAFDMMWNGEIDEDITINEVDAIFNLVIA